MAQASALVREELARVRAALVQERQVAASGRKSNMLIGQRVHDALRRQGLADPAPLLDELLALGGAQRAPDAAKAYAANPRLREALTRYQEWDNERRLALVEASYNKSLEVLDELGSQHERFEAGEPFTFLQLVSKLEQLRAITEQLT